MDVRTKTMRDRMVLLWKAKRSGASVTVTGKKIDGSDVMLTRVALIEKREDGAWAIQEDGAEHPLS